MKKIVQAGWNEWRRMSGVICERRVPARVKRKVYKVAVRPAMLYGLETVALTKRQEADVEVAELKILRFSLGVDIKPNGDGESAVETLDGRNRNKKKKNIILMYACVGVGAWVRVTVGVFARLYVQLSGRWLFVRCPRDNVT